MEIHHFFLELVIVLFSARVLGELFSKFQIPPVIGEILAGVLIGPSVFGWVEVTPMLKLLADIGIILLLFEVGLETDLGRLSRTGYRPFLVALVGVVAPFLFGYLISAYWFHLPILVSLLIGATLTATSIGITMRILGDLNQQKSKEAQIVLGAAVIDDVIGVILLAFLYEFAVNGSISVFNASKVLIFIVLFMLIAPFVAKFFSVLVRRYSTISVIPGLIPSTIIALLLFFAWMAYQVGAPELLGGFAAGLALSPRFFIPFGSMLKQDPQFSHQVEKEIKPIVHLFAPIFFVVVGASLNLHLIDWGSLYLWQLTGLLLIAAFIGKLLAGLCLFNETRFSKWAIGLAMLPRGEVGIIFAEIGKNVQLFDETLYAAVLLVITLTTLAAPFALRWLYRYQTKE